MSKKQPLLVIWWPDAHLQQQAEEAGQLLKLRYEVIGLTGQTLSQGIDSVSKLPKDLPCLVLLDQSDTTFIGVKPPAISGKKLRDALPFLVEPFLLNDPEENLVSLWSDGLPLSPDQQLATVVTKSRLRGVCQLLNSQGLQVVGISSEGLLKPSQPAAWLSGTTLWLMDGESPPTGINTAQPGLVTALLSKKARGGSKYAISEKHLLSLSAALNRGELPCMESVTSDLRPDMLTLRGRLVLSGSEFSRFGLKTKSVSNNSGLDQLKRPAFVLATVGLIGLNALAWQASAIETDLQAQIEQTYKRVLPTVPMVADPLVLIERERRRLNAGTQTTDNTGLPYLLHQAGLALDAAPFNSMQDIEWDGKVLRLGFASTVTIDVQEAALSNMSSRNLQGKWVTAQDGTVRLELRIREGR